MNHREIFRTLICVDLSSEAGRRKLHGIYRFLGSGYVWDMSMIRSQREFDDTFQDLVRGTSFDGFLISMPESTEFRRLHRELGIPTVFFDYVDADLLATFKECVFIHDNDKDIGSRAVQHLMSQGKIASYGYAASSAKRTWSENRGKQFASCLAKQNFTVSCLPEADTIPTESIVKWLQSMPTPIGVLAAYDDTARRVLNACRQTGLRVPADVSILGVGNDELVCPQTTPPLSSIIPDFEGEGYRAARELQALMLRKRPPAQREIVCGCKGIAARGTTVNGKYAAALVQQAIAFIKENAFKSITANDVVSQLHVSRRLADLRFREITGTSILSYITGIRLDKVKHLLKTTDLRIDEIARHCGYDAANLKNLFARHCGCSMRDYRKRCHA